MTLEELIPWLQGGNGIRGIPETDVDKCPRGMLINITDMDDKQALKFALGHMPEFANLTVVRIGIPKPEAPKPKAVQKAKRTIAEATEKTITVKKVVNKMTKKDGKDEK